jgi:hypothetical protein
MALDMVVCPLRLINMCSAWEIPFFAALLNGRIATSRPWTHFIWSFNFKLSAMARFTSTYYSEVTFLNFKPVMKCDMGVTMVKEE